MPAARRAVQRRLKVLGAKAVNIGTVGEEKLRDRSVPAERRKVKRLEVGPRLDLVDARARIRGIVGYSSRVRVKVGARVMVRIFLKRSGVGGER